VGKVKIFHFHNGAEGGVLSYIRNLISHQQHPEIENHVIYTINRSRKEPFEVFHIEGVKSSQVFFYSSTWNFYHTCTQLAKLVPDDKVILVAHDWLELGMCSNLGLNNLLIHVVHGAYDYYYDLAQRHCNHVDRYLCVSGHIKAELQLRMPNLTNKIVSALAPVTLPRVDATHFENVCCAFFVRDLNDSNKQLSILPKIDDILLSTEGIKVEWFVAGGGMSRDEFYQIWNSESHSRVHFFGKVDHMGLAKMLDQVNVMILPSFNEGLPISVIEAMKAGKVPIVGSWASSIDHYILDNINGFIADQYSSQSFADIITKLANNSAKLKEVGLAAKQSADRLFNPNANAKFIEDMILGVPQRVSIKEPLKVYGSSLDHPWIPNFITNLIRKAF
jgi:hypothetical protein